MSKNSKDMKSLLWLWGWLFSYLKNKNEEKNLGKKKLKAIKIVLLEDFPGGPVAKTPYS